MPKYQVELTDGRKFVVESETEPTESDVMVYLTNQAAPAGAAALSQAEGIAATPWYAKNYPAYHPSLRHRVPSRPWVVLLVGS